MAKLARYSIVLKLDSSKLTPYPDGSFVLQFDAQKKGVTLYVDRGRALDAAKAAAAESPKTKILLFECTEVCEAKVPEVSFKKWSENGEYIPTDTPG